MMEIMQVNMDQIKSLLITVDQLNNDLFHEKWKFRYVARRLKQVAMETDQPDIAVTVPDEYLVSPSQFTASVKLGDVVNSVGQPILAV